MASKTAVSACVTVSPEGVVQEVIEKLEKEVICSHCKKRYQNPKFLQCCHENVSLWTSRRLRQSLLTVPIQNVVVPLHFPRMESEDFSLQFISIAFSKLDPWHAQEGECPSQARVQEL